MIFFIVTIILFLFGIYDVFGKNQKIKEYLLKGILIFLVLFLGTRGFLGWDWYFYYPSFMSNEYIYEPGYMFYSTLIGSIFKNYIFYQFITTLIDIIILYFIFKRYCKYKIMAFAIFFSIQGFYMEVELLRNFKTILLFLISLEYIEKKNIYMFYLLNAIGFLFHKSALLYFPMYFILDRNYNKKVIVNIFILGSLYYIFDFKFMKILSELNIEYFPEIFKEKFLLYKEYLFLDLKRGVNIFYIERLLAFYFTYKYEQNKLIKNSVYIWVFLFLFTSELSIASLRISILFIYGAWLVFVRVLENEKIKVLGFVLITLLGLIRMYNSLIFPGNKINYVYENVFFYPLDYQKREQDIKKSKKFLKESFGKELLIQY